MHKLNFCGTLCLPKAIDGYDCRGIKSIKEFEEGVVMAMAGAAAPYHAIYASKPIVNGKIYALDELSDRVSIVEADKLGAISADHALDPDTRADELFKTRDDSLKSIAEALFRDGHKYVTLWANSGIGNEVAKNGEENGVIRDRKGTAIACRVNGKEHASYKKGIATSYQNSAHQHIHIAPSDGFHDAFEKILAASHHFTHRASLNDAREHFRDFASSIPTISLCVLADTDALSKELKFTHYSGSDSYLFPQVTMSGLARAIVMNYHKAHRKMNFESKPFKKDWIKRTEEFYSKNL